MPRVIDGSVAPGFEAVRQEFERNFEKRRELGGRRRRLRRGGEGRRPLGRRRDARDDSPWQRGTLVILYSTSKGLAAMTLALAHSRGWLDYDARVADIWPEFGQHGKEDITIRQLLAHEAGLPVIDERLNADTLEDFDAVADAIARQKPA